MLEVGMKAPDFTLEDKDGNEVSLSDFYGRRVAVYFYPKDNTSGCTRQACAFRDVYAELREAGCEVIGISRDSINSHAGFARKHSLPFVLLSDPDRSVAEAYGVMQEKKLYGKTAIGVVRSVFLVDADGTLLSVKYKADPDECARELLREFFSA